MSNSELYLESLQSLSNALNKAVALTLVRRKKGLILSQLRSVPSNEQNAIWEKTIETIPQITQLQDQERALNQQYNEQIQEAINSALDYITHLDENKLTDTSMESLQKHMELVYDVVSAHYSQERTKISISQEKLSEVYTKLSLLSRYSQAQSIKNNVLRIEKLLSTNYVGEK